ncbi:MAG: DegT/DnrJ/EryC1/StrS family aminotransferase [Verrucomicrobiia bacterium]
MKREKKTQISDFRYATGAAKIGWPAVGEPMRPDDVMKVVEFLVPVAPDGQAAYRRKLADVRRAIGGLAAAGNLATKLTLGNRVKELEQAVQKYLNVRHALFLTNATAGFEIAYKMAGLAPGDEVIVPAITFIATIVYPLSIGAKVVLADLDPRTLNIDPADVARKITPRTRMIVPVHIGGWPVDMAPIMRLARQHGLIVLEDAAHGFGGSYRGRRLGTIGHFGAYSFHEVKNINALGEGGILVTNTRFGHQFGKSRFVGLDLSKKIPNWLYDVVAIDGMRGPFVAGNHSATEIQAVALESQLHRVDEIIAVRRAAARELNRRFQHVAGLRGTPMDHGTTRGTHHLYQLQIDPQVVGADIQDLKRKLTERGVTQIPHFGPLYKFQILRQLGYDTAAIEASCPVCEDLFNHRFTHLPIYGLSAKQIRYLGDAVIESVAELRRGAA